MTERTLTEKVAITMLPVKLSRAVLDVMPMREGEICEIRLRRDGPLTVTVDGKEIKTGVVCSEDDISHTVRALSGNSLYSHADTIREGYICADGGIRAGVCGRAIVRNGEIDAVTEISSINVRIPHRVPGAADGVFKLLKNLNKPAGVLVYSKPGVGKTTLLRELISRLSYGDSAKRVAVVDTRFELTASLNEEELFADFLCGYPRSKGIEIAVRTLSPDYVVCDEISTPVDAAAVEEASSMGVGMIASCHASSFSEISCSPVIGPLIEKRVFSIYVGLLSRDLSGPGYVLDVRNEKDVR